MSVSEGRHGTYAHGYSGGERSPSSPAQEPSVRPRELATAIGQEWDSPGWTRLPGRDAVATVGRRDPRSAIQPTFDDSGVGPGVAGPIGPSTGVRREER